MLLTLTTTHRPATDLGYLLHKNPARAQRFEVSVGTAHVFYPEAGDERCTAALLVDVDPVQLVRGRPRRGAPSGIDQYVNDRPYAASSYLSVALGDLFGTAMSGRCKERPELAATPIPLRAVISAVPCHGGEELVRRLFEPLGYTVSVHGEVLDESFPDWGPSPYHRVSLEATVRLADLLTAIYVLVPVLDGEKHYWVGDDEIDKLLRRGQGWLAAHPDRELIVHRYLERRRSLTREALRRLAEEDQPDVDEAASAHDAEEEALEERISLNEQRMNAVLAVLRAAGAARVVDVGCGEGNLLRRLVHNCPTGDTPNSPTSPNQMQQQVLRGQAPRGVAHVDSPNPFTDDAQPHVHFDGWRSTLDQDGTWGHGDGSDANLTKQMTDWLQRSGWGTPSG